AKKRGIDEPYLYVIEILSPISITIEDPSEVIYTFELDPDRLDILATCTLGSRIVHISNLMIFHDYKANLYITSTQASYYYKAPDHVCFQARIHEITAVLLNQISKDLFPDTLIEKLSPDDFSIFVQEFISRYYYLVDPAECSIGETPYWNIFEQLFTPEKIYAYVHAKTVQKRIEQGYSPIHLIANLMEKIDTLACDPLRYISSKKVAGLSLVQLDKKVATSLLDEFLFPKERITEILDSLPADDERLGMARKLSPHFLAYLLVTNYNSIFRSRRSLDAIKNIQYEMTANMIRSGKHDFDICRRNVNQKIEDFDRKFMGKTTEELQEKIVKSLFDMFSPDFKQQLCQLLIDRKLMNSPEIESIFAEHIYFQKVLEIIRYELNGRDDISDIDRQIITDKLHTWSSFIDEIADEMLHKWMIWQEAKNEELAQLRNNVQLPQRLRKEEQLLKINRILCYLFPRIYFKIPRFKNLRKPTIIFIHGGAGVGKSTIGNVIAKKLGIPTYFRATITREVLRHFIPYYSGEEIHRSSYQGRPTIEGFYDQGLRVAKAIETVLDRAIKENTSVMIESGVLLPGTLSHSYYKRSNIVEIFLSAPNNKITHRRMLIGSVSLGRDREKRMKNFQSIRLLDFVLRKLARERDITVLEHKTMDEMIKSIMDRVLDPYADRWYGMLKDSVIEKVKYSQSIRDEKMRSRYIRLPFDGSRLCQTEYGLSAEHESTLKLIGVEKLESLVNKHVDLLAKTQEYLYDVCNQEFSLLFYLLSQVDEPYDHVRQSLFYLLNNSRNVSHLVTNLKEFLYPVMISQLHRELEQDGYQAEELLGTGSHESLVYDLWDIPEVKDIHIEKYRSMVKRWTEDIETHAQNYFRFYTCWKDAYSHEEEQLFRDGISENLIPDSIDGNLLHELVRENYLQANPEIERLKGLDKPLIVLVSGASGVGKSTISKALKMNFNIPTSFSTDLLREEIRKLVPRKIWPQVHTSSFKMEGDIGQRFFREIDQVKGRPEESILIDEWRKQVLEHYYAHSLVIFEGVRAAINRQIERNQSVIIEGIPLIPGSLPARYYKEANIIHLVITIQNEQQHLSRWDKRALEQPKRYKEGSKRYKESFVPIRFISTRLEEVAQETRVKVINNISLDESVAEAIEYVSGPHTDRFVSLADTFRKDVSLWLAHRSREPLDIWGAWCTDIDDTVILSGKKPSESQMDSINRLINALASKKIAWVPMSGVAFEKIKPRFLDRIHPDLKKHVIFYGGDGSSKYIYDAQKKAWQEDGRFRKLLSDAQAIAIMGLKEYRKQLTVNLSVTGSLVIDESDIKKEVETRIDNARSILENNGFDPDRGIIDELKEVLHRNGFKPDNAETYYRGGSVSWMMLGDIDAESYAEEQAQQTRKELLGMVDIRLRELNYLMQLSPTKTRVENPFPGARGIKFVLSTNNKERCVRNLIEQYNLMPREILFVGNEIFEGGNDNVVTAVKGLNLLSVGHKTGEGVVFGGFGVVANQMWYDMVSQKLNELEMLGGEAWVDILSQIKNGELHVSGQEDVQYN
ncbi:MAG: hypothetical protein JW920_06960, partial [Deltaproteobacteria bacterium]|nr:hypothetical protein [Deltaproteobacteria bacterium]